MRLGEIAHFEVGSQFHPPGIRGDLVQDGLQKGCLACAIRSDHSDTFTPFQYQVRYTEKRSTFVLITHLQIVGAQNQVAGTVSQLEAQMHRSDIRPGRSQPRVCQQSLQAALPAPGLVVVLCAQEAPNIVLLLFDILVLCFKLRQAPRVAFLTLA